MEKHIQRIDECQLVRTMRAKTAGHMKSGSDTRESLGEGDT